MGKKNAIESVSLWTLIEGLQQRFEDLGFDSAAADAAVMNRVQRLFRKRSRNDQRLGDLSLLTPAEPVNV
jgi:hypothetical protein